VLVDISDEARRRAWAIPGSIAEAGMGALDRYTDQEILLIRDFFGSGPEFLNANLAQITSLPADGATPRCDRRAGRRGSPGARRP
jgi:hypothetical protein